MLPCVSGNRLAVTAYMVVVIFLRESALQILWEFLMHHIGKETVGEMLCACDFGEDQGALLHLTETDIVTKEAMFCVSGAVLQRTAVGRYCCLYGGHIGFSETECFVAADILDALCGCIYVMDPVVVGRKCEEDMIGMLADFAACCQGFAIVDDSGEDERKERGEDRIACEICARLW